MNTKLHIYLVIAAAAVLLAVPTGTRADAVTDWNAITVTTVTTPPGRPGATGVLDFATVQGAVYDAVQAIEGDYQPYCTSIPGATGSPDAAVAKAAYDVLVNRFPGQTMTLTTTYQNYLTAHGISMLDAGIPVGATAAACMIALRANDGSFPVNYPPFFGYVEIGKWRSATPMVTPWLGNVTPFTLRSSSQMLPGPPPDLDSPGYARAYNEVKRLGGDGVITPTERTGEQTELANFWNLSYPVVMMRVARDISVAHVDNVSDSSRLLALTSMSMADALIAAWNAKTTYVFWRPSMAIRDGANDGNPKTIGDPSWTPFLSNPAYPDYTSGANNLAAAATRSLSLFFETNEFTFTVTTTNPGPTNVDTRTYHKFSDVRDEVVDARIYEGIHFRFADVKARKQGEHIAQWANGHFFQPVE